MTGQGEYRSAGELAHALADRQVGALELVDAAISAIEARDATLNAVVVRDFERARAAAKEADGALARGERRPLLGVPITVKESFQVAGLPTCWGTPLFKDFVAREDAVAVQRLKQAGAIVLGKTNVPVWLGDTQSFNPIYGRTLNPWHLERSPGGSSGGSAVALAAGYVALELGSDIGGSIRVPAHFCGLFGHKPSFAILPMRGHGLPGMDAPADLSVIGPLARTAEDLSLALDVVAGPDVPESAAWGLDLPAPRANALSGFRVLLLDHHPLVPVASDIRRALNDLADRLARAGAAVSRDTSILPDLVEANRIFETLLLPIMAARLPEANRQAYLKAGEAAAAEHGPQSLAALRLKALALSHAEWIYANNARARLKAKWAEVFAQVDVVLCPPTAVPAFPLDESPDLEARRLTIDGEKVRYLDQTIWSGIATAPHLPATVAPIARSSEGLPIGVQIIGPAYGDRTTIAFAAALEREFGGFTPPPGYAP